MKTGAASSEKKVAVAGAPSSAASGSISGAGGSGSRKKKKKINSEAFAQASQNMGLSSEEDRKFKDPKVVDAMMDPRVQKVVEQSVVGFFAGTVPKRRQRVSKFENAPAIFGKQQAYPIPERVHSRKGCSNRVPKKMIPVPQFS